MSEINRTLADGVYSFSTGGPNVRVLCSSQPFLVPRVVPSFSSTVQIIQKFFEIDAIRFPLLSLANCYFAHISSGFPALLPCFDAPSDGSLIVFLL
jgi:hypothetical protein